MSLRQLHALPSIAPDRSWPATSAVIINRPCNGSREFRSGHAAYEAAGFTVQIDAIRSALSFIGLDSDASITLYYYRLRVRSTSGLAVSRNRECAYFSDARLYKR